MGGVYGYYNTMNAKISVNKDEKISQGFLYNLMRRIWKACAASSWKIHKKPLKTVIFIVREHFQ